MEIKRKYVTLPCDCGCCMLVVEKNFYDDGGVDYLISVQDSRYNHNHNTLWGRLKSAAKILFGKPVYYNDIYLPNEENFKAFLKDITLLSQEEF